jgi:YD repeat-containing protein
VTVKNYLRSRGWKDFIFICAAVALWAGVRHYLSPSPPSDYAKWKARVKAAPQLSISDEPGQSGHPPCFFIVPEKAVNHPTLDSGSVDDCLSLLPNGQRLDIFEISLVGGFLPIKTDLYVPDRIPLAFTRTYVPLTTWSERFQVFLPHVYDPFLTGSRFPYTYVDWLLPDDQSVHYDRISPGTEFSDAIFGAVSSSRIFAGSRVNWNGFGWDWTLPDGTTYLSPEAYNATRPQQGSLVGIFDGNGNEVRLSRGASGELTEIKSPEGHWIRLEYDHLRMIRARDSSGNAVEYEYDPDGRLSAVRYPGGNATKYSYDTENRVVEVEDPSEDVAMEIKYGSNGAVAAAIATDSEHTYHFRYSLDKASETLNAFVDEPHGKVIQVRIRNEKGKLAYSIQK